MRAPRSTTKRQRHKKWLKRAKGYRGRRSRVFKIAKEAVLKAGQHSYHDRRKKKGQFRSRWQTQINAAVRGHDLSYSRFMHQLKSRQIELDRKVLADMAVNHPELLDQLIEHIKTKDGAKAK